MLVVAARYMLSLCLYILYLQRVSSVYTIVRAIDIEARPRSRLVETVRAVPVRQWPVEWNLYLLWPVWHTMNLVYDRVQQ